jgi:hypothetical protein
MLAPLMASSVPSIPLSCVSALLVVVAFLSAMCAPVPFSVSVTLLAMVLIDPLAYSSRALPSR